MPAAEFDRWIQYWHQEPFGAWRDNYHMAKLASLYMTVHAKKGRSFSVDEFMLKSPQQLRRQRTRQTMAALDAIAVPKAEGAE